MLERMLWSSKTSRRILFQLWLITHSVFAIHGLGSNAASAWTYRNDTTEVRWLKDILPEIEGLESTRVVMVNHQTRWDANTANMKFEDHAAMILGDIESLRMVCVFSVCPIATAAKSRTIDSAYETYYIYCAQLWRITPEAGSVCPTSNE
jgi:hypothetical protein